MLACEITTFHANIYPSRKGILEVLKIDGSNGTARFTEESGAINECVFTMPSSSAGGIYATPWKRLITADDIAQIVSDIAKLKQSAGME